MVAKNPAGDMAKFLKFFLLHGEDLPTDIHDQFLAIIDFLEDISKKEGKIPLKN